MIRFNLFGFPVSIQWTFWLMAAFLSGAISARGSAEWNQAFLYILVIFVSILVHELGHALFQRKYGGKSAITIYALGGFASSVGRYTRKESIIITAMGPIFSLLLAILGMLWWNSYTDQTWNFFKQVYPVSQGQRIAGNLAWLNCILVVLNLLPIFPFDGGRLLEQFMRGGNPVLRFRIGMVTAAIVGFYALTTWGQPFLGLLFGYMAYENFKRSRGESVQGLFGG